MILFQLDMLHSGEWEGKMIIRGGHNDLEKGSCGLFEDSMWKIFRRD